MFNDTLPLTRVPSLSSCPPRSPICICAIKSEARDSGPTEFEPAPSVQRPNEVAADTASYKGVAAAILKIASVLSKLTSICLEIVDDPQRYPEQRSNLEQLGAAYMKGRRGAGVAEQRTQCGTREGLLAGGSVVSHGREWTQRPLLALTRDNQEQHASSESVRRSERVAGGAWYVPGDACRGAVNSVSSASQHTAWHRSAPQGTAANRKAPLPTARQRNPPQGTAAHCKAPQCTAAHCPHGTTVHHKAPHSTATHRSSLQRTAAHRNALQLTAVHCKAPQCTAAHRMAQQRTARHQSPPQGTTRHRSASQGTAAHCKAPQCTAAHRSSPHIMALPPQSVAGGAVRLRARAATATEQPGAARLK
ncbi:unnamed protein product [Closterium sp. NIES-64]|nr:unnamed protein product [Closterium sp. NIES-64]